MYKILFIIALSGFILVVISSIISIIIMKKNNKKMKDRINKLDLPTEPLSVRIASIDSLLPLIDTMISISIISRRKFEIFLNTPNKNLDYDEVIKDVSTEVFEGLRGNIVIDSNLVFSEKYLMKYIIDKTTIAYIGYIKDNISKEL